MKLHKIGAALVISAALTVSGASMASAAGHVHHAVVKSPESVAEKAAAKKLKSSMYGFVVINVKSKDWRPAKFRFTTADLLDEAGVKSGFKSTTLDVTGFNKKNTKAAFLAMGDRLGVSDSLVCTPVAAPKAKIVKGKKVKAPRVFVLESCTLSAPQGGVSPNFSFDAKLNVFSNNTTTGSMKLVNDPRQVL